MLYFQSFQQKGTNDAVITLCDFVAEHIQMTRRYVRILFVDFSSAFNSILIDIILQK